MFSSRKTYLVVPGIKMNMKLMKTMGWSNIFSEIVVSHMTSRTYKQKEVAAKTQQKVYYISRKTQIMLSN